MKTTHIIEMDQEKTLQSFGEKFTRILIKMRILPVHINSDDTVIFKMFSCDYLLFLSVYYIPFYILLSLPWIIWPELEITKLMVLMVEAFGGNKTDAIASFGFAYIVAIIGGGTCISVAKGNT